MTEKQIRDLFTLWQKRLGLYRWHIRVDFEAIDPETVTMCIHRSLDYERAIIKVQPWLLTGTPPKDWEGVAKGVVSDLDIEEAVVHELLHAVIGPLCIWHALLEHESHRDALDTANRAHTKIEEGIVDRLAVALVREWPS